MNAPLSGNAALRHVDALDGVRGLAVLLVLLFHGFAVSADGCGATTMRALFSPGWLGVDLFFVLSGFLITGILARTRAAPGYFRSFYTRRALRIFPAYFAVLGFALLIYPHFNATLAQSDTGRYALPLALFAQNWVTALTGHKPGWPGLDHFWSLHVEEQFYLFWPLLVWLTPARWLPRLCLAMFGASVLLKLELAAHHAGWSLIYLWTPSRLEGLAAGAYLAGRGDRTWPRGMFALPLAAVALALIVLLRWGTSLYDPHVLALLIPAATVLFAALLDRARRPGAVANLFSARWLTYLGRRSYGLYLIHWVLYYQVAGWVYARTEALPAAARALLMGGAVIALTLLAAELMFRAIEAPALRLKRFAPVPAARSV